MAETRCSVCGATQFQESQITISDMETGRWSIFCFGCGAREVAERLSGIPFSIELPDFRKYTGAELGHTAVNYTAEVVEPPVGWEPLKDKRLKSAREIPALQDVIAFLGQVADRYTPDEVGSLSAMLNGAIRRIAQELDRRRLRGQGG